MLRVIIFTHGGAEALVNRLLNLPEVEIGGILVEPARKPERSLSARLRRSLKYEGFYATVRKLVSSVFSRSAGGEVLERINEKQSLLEKFASENQIPFHRVDDYHSQSSLDLIRSLRADLGILYGTNIIGEQVFSIPRLGSINLHQGLAPHYRGGPTVFWELFNDETELGITVHFVVSKVDAGDIIVQRKIPLNYDFEVYGLEYDRFLEEYRRSLKEPSVALIAEAVEKIARGNAPRMAQDLSVGKRYRLPTKREKDQLRSILRKRWKATAKVMYR